MRQRSHADFRHRRRRAEKARRRVRLRGDRGPRLLLCRGEEVERRPQESGTTHGLRVLTGYSQGTARRTWRHGSSAVQRQCRATCRAYRALPGDSGRMGHRNMARHRVAARCNFIFSIRKGSVAQRTATRCSQHGERVKAFRLSHMGHIYVLQRSAPCCTRVHRRPSVSAARTSVRASKPPRPRAPTAPPASTAVQPYDSRPQRRRRCRRRDRPAFSAAQGVRARELGLS